MSRSVAASLVRATAIPRHSSDSALLPRWIGSVIRTRRHVVVTGVDALAPLGGSANITWRALLSGSSGARSLSSALMESYSLDSPSLGRDLELRAKLGCDMAAAVPLDAMWEALNGSLRL